ncbi:MAG: quercetin dioxygenase-like cupin family protein [Gammaproteobacteria bacterium]|jgi:quercetin dioxygenase-like cupin family protein
MRIQYLLSAAILTSAMALSSVAGTNEIFEVKTATAGIKVTTDNVLSNATRAERKAKRLATKANIKTLKAYTRCPNKPRGVEKRLESALQKLYQYQVSLTDVSTSSAELDALADFADATISNIEDFLGYFDGCDTGATLTQAQDIEYSIPTAPFVDFAPGWGTLYSSAHGTFGDFKPESAAPDHVHSGTYYGIVISGIVKNPFGESPNSDVVGAKPLAAGSFWSVPANAIHTTACDAGPDTNCVFYFHSRSAFDFNTDLTHGEANDASAQEISADEIAAELAKPEAVVSPFARMVTLWGNRETGAHGTVGQFIAGGASPLHTHSFSYHGVVLTGTMVNPFLGQPVAQARQLSAGDYWFVPAGVDHVTACVSEEPCTFYFHSEGLFDFLPPSASDN